MFSSAGNVILLAFGFGFVIFWHELGHFLAAKWADVKVEQFAVGFGQALLSYRKGMGVRWGSTQGDYQSKLRVEVERTVGQTLQFKEQVGGATSAQLSDAGRVLGISETEYRLNWIPLGGYVKMLGQDDLKPGEQVADPRSYTAKPVGKRMVIVSAGVLMNVVLAFLGFMVYFRLGPHVVRPTVGLVVPGSPASMAYRLAPGGAHVPAPLLPGDTILKLNGRWQADFDKVRLNTMLLTPGTAVPLEVQRADGRTVETVYVTPAKQTVDSEFPQLGIAQMQTLATVDPATLKVTFDADTQSPELDAIHPGETITAIDGHPVTGNPADPADTAPPAAPLYDAVQASCGRPVPVLVRSANGVVRPASLAVHFTPRFGFELPDFGGLQMLSSVSEVDDKSTLKGKVHPGDVIVAIADVDPSGGQRAMPNRAELLDFIHHAADAGAKVTVTVSHDGKPLPPMTVQLDKSHSTLGLILEGADQLPVVARPPDGSPAAGAGVPAGATLTAFDGRPVHSWFAVSAAVQTLTADKPFTVAATVDGQPQAYTFKTGLPASAVDAARGDRLETYAQSLLQPSMTVRRAGNVLTAADWGVGETRDAIMQVKQTIMAMVHGTISPKEISGPLGILAVGYKIAESGTLRLLWFLSIISANLAVMNFLPIPVVDGGLFTFLLIEKVKGSPISQRTQSIAQAAGLVLLLGVFLFATYQDVFRMSALFH